MFDASGNYAPPDSRTPHALVATKTHKAILRSGGPVNLPAGHVFQVAPLGASEYDSAPRHPNNAAEAVWIEHTTAQPGDVLSMDVVMPAVATAKTRAEAVAKYRAAEAAKPQPPVVAPLTAEEIAALRALIPKTAPGG